MQSPTALLLLLLLKSDGYWREISFKEIMVYTLLYKNNNRNWNL